MPFEPTADAEGSAQISPLQTVAAALAPVVHLHSQEKHFPCSVEWYLKRVQAVHGDPGQTYTVSSPSWAFPEPFGTVVAPGPLTPQTLAAVSSASNWGGASDDSYSLWPLRAAPGQTPSWSFFNSSPLSVYQRETTYGEPLTAGNLTSAAPGADPSVAAGPPLECTADAYYHLTTQDDYILINYYFFYAYNGGLGPEAMWGAEPLGILSGFNAHFADLERVTAQVRLHGDTLDNTTVDLLSVTFEHHGTGTPFNDSTHFFTARPLAQLRPIEVYSCWHSHASWPNPGSHPTDTPFAVDEADETGVLWRTGSSLIYLDTGSPAWIAFNGDYGARLKINSMNPVNHWAPDLTGGPEGPAFHSSWTTFADKPTTEWSGDIKPQPVKPDPVPLKGSISDVLDFGPAICDFGDVGMQPVGRDLELVNKTADPLTVTVQVASALAADRADGQVLNPQYPAVVSVYLADQTDVTIPPNSTTTVQMTAAFPLEAGWNVYSPSDFAGGAAVTVTDYFGFLATRFSGTMNGGLTKPGVGAHVPLPEDAAPKFRLPS